MSSNATTELKPIYLYDHLPGILAGYPALLFLLFALLAYPIWPKTISFEEGTKMADKAVFYELAESDDADDGEQQNADEPSEGQTSDESDAPDDAVVQSDSFQSYVGTVNPHMLFWVGLCVMLVWYIAFAFNLPKKRFLLVFGLLGTFVGIPVALELAHIIKPFEAIGGFFGNFAPEINAGGWALLAIAMTGIWLSSLDYSRTQLMVKIDGDGLTLNQLGGKGERFELIGLKTENEPLDYLELFLAGVGTLSLKTRMNKPIFTMKRVLGLYRTWWWPFSKGKLAQIEELLSIQVKGLGGDRGDAIDAAEMDDGLGEEEFREEREGPGHRSTNDEPGEIS